MAKTTFATDNALTKKAWEATLFKDTPKRSFFGKFQGAGADNIMQVKEQLKKSKGDKVTFGIRMRLSGAGVTSHQALEGNEEKLTTYSDSVTLEEYAHAVRDAGPLDRQRAMFSIDSESENALRDWIAEKQDQLAFDALFDAGDFSNIVYMNGSGVPTYTATASTAKSGISDASNSKIAPALISFAKTWALTGGNRAQTPLRPIMVGGQPHFVLLIHPDVAYDLQVNSTYAQAQREAHVRGEKNPLFTGALGVWNGVIVHTHENCPIAADGGGGAIKWAKSALLGAQALLWAWGKEPSVRAEDFDYGREHGFGVSMMCGVTKAEFDSKDYGVLGVYTARTQISDAS